MVERIYLDEFKPVSELVVEKHENVLPPFPVIDFHNHLRGRTDLKELIKIMDRNNIEIVVNLVRDQRDDLAECIEYYKAAEGRVVVFGNIDISRIDEPDFASDVEEQVERGYSLGMKGVKFFKSLGLRYKDKSGKYIMPDDPRLAPLWKKCAELGLPVLIHIADPVAFFKPIDRFNERYEELAAHPDWSYYGKGCPSFEELLASQENLLKNNPDTTFCIAHVGSYAENLKYVGEMLDKYPNMYVDTAERIAELGRQPYTARDFIIKYQDRVLYGTDVFPGDRICSFNYRFYQTRDEYFPYNDFEVHNQGRWYIYGIYLPEPVLRKVYRENALKLLNLKR